MRRKYVAFSGKVQSAAARLPFHVRSGGQRMGNFYAVDHLVLADASMLNKMCRFYHSVQYADFEGEPVA